MGVAVLSAAMAHMLSPIELKICTRIHDDPKEVPFVNNFGDGGHGSLHPQTILVIFAIFHPIELCLAHTFSVTAC